MKRRVDHAGGLGKSYQVLGIITTPCMDISRMEISLIGSPLSDDLEYDHLCKLGNTPPVP
jgi:hypothetical protein